MTNKKLIYLTYQTFPANTANSSQTILNIHHLIQEGVEVELYFPLRSPESSDEINKIKSFYNIDSEFKIVGCKHNYPHGKLNFAKGLWFHFSHFFWSKNIINNYFKEDTKDVFFTRSEWVAYFLAMKDRIVVFEIHQTSKIRNLVVKKLKNMKNVKFIFLNENLQKKYHIYQNATVLHNGTKLSNITPNNILSTNPNSIIFVGNISRFEKSRGLEDIIKWFEDPVLKNNYVLEIVGGSKKSVESLKKIVSKLNLENCIFINGWVNKESIIHRMQKSNIGLLMNNYENLHSYFYTSPLKYFEYLNSKLSVVAVDFPSHRALPFNENISFFDYGDKYSFIDALNKSKTNKPLTDDELFKVSLNNRAKKIISFIF